MKQLTILLFLCTIFLSSCLSGRQETSESENIRTQKESSSNTLGHIEGDHEHSSDTHTHEDQKENSLPPIPISSFGEGIEGITTVNSYNSIASNITVKLHGSLIDIDGNQLGNTEFKYGIKNEEVFESLGSSSSDAEGFYFIKFPIQYQQGEKIAYIDISIENIISRIYLIPQDFNPQDFLEKEENLQTYFYFTLISQENNSIIAGVDIVVN